MKPYAIYSRKSRATDRGESIGNQVTLCKGYLKAIAGESSASQALVYEDEGFSGKNLDRPQFRRMMQTAREEGFTAIIVYRLDRISRNIGDFANLIEELNRLRIGFVSIREQFDTTSPMGRAMMYLSSVFSQLERETIAERIRDNMQELAKTGRWLGGNTPLGYASQSIRLTGTGKTEKRAFCLVCKEEEADIVRKIFRLYLQTGSLAQTEEQLCLSGSKTRRGNAFTRFAIKDILLNPVYLMADQQAYRYFHQRGAVLYAPKERFTGEHGMMIYNRTLQQTGKAHKHRPESEWIVTVGVHAGLVPGKDWIRVQTMLADSAKAGPHRVHHNKALLAGMLFCQCGAPMRVKTAGTGKYYYLCTRKEKSRRTACASTNLDGPWLDEQMLTILGRCSFQQTLFARLTNQKFDKVQNGESHHQIKEIISCANSFQKRELLRTQIDRVIWLEKQQKIHVFFIGADNPKDIVGKNGDGVFPEENTIDI